MEAGFLGVGNMGLPMAGKLLDGGHRLTVYDIRDAAIQPLLDRQARRAASPKDLADQCEIVFVSLPTLAAFRAVTFGENGLIRGSAMKLLVNTCTVGVPFVKEIEKAMAAQGVTVVDCPISGGPPGARALMLGAINAGSGRNSATEAKFPIAVLTRSFDFGAEMHILMKDIDLAIAQGEELGVPMWVCEAARLVFKHAIHKGAAHEDLTAIVKFIERDAGFEMAKTR
jgi:3-hydroxyisobutyrate dehydrogenase-like beta-hydroxyacid dehydrogenase